MKKNNTFFFRLKNQVFSSMKIVLIGYMGSGKSTIGNALASVIKAPFFDLDAEIEREEENTIQNIFEQKGEIYFRKKEQATIFNLLKQNGTNIIATGGGTPCYGNIMQKLVAEKDIKTIFLKASIETLTQRLSLEKDKRPLISHLQTNTLVNDFIRKHLFERNFYYFQAKNTVEVDAKSKEEIVEEIVASLF